MRIVSSAFKGINLCLVGACGRHSNIAAVTLARACGATVHTTVQASTHVVFSGRFRRYDASIKNLELADNFAQTGIRIAIVAGDQLERFVTGELSIHDFLVNPLLPPIPAAGPYASAL
jgi:hypothetical protein